MKKHFISTLILIVYSTILIKMMVFRDIPIIRINGMIFNFGGADTNGEVNFVPFKTILSYLFGHKGWLIAGVNLVGNVVLLVPLGFLILFIFRNMTWERSLVVALVIPIIIEGMQVLLYTGIFDIDDVILNALGVIIGYFTFLIISKRLNGRILRTE